MTLEKGKIELKNWELVSVNPLDKKWNWTDLFCFWGISIQTIIGFSLITSLYLVYELDFTVVLLGCLIGTSLVFLFANLIGKPSQKYGVPFPVLLRVSMGYQGAKYIALLRGLVGVFMFGVQTFFLSKSFGYLIRISLFSFDNSILDRDIFLVFFVGLNIIDWFSYSLALILQLFLFSRGHSFNRLLIRFSAFFVYLGMIIFVIFLFSKNYVYIITSLTDILRLEKITNINSITAILSIAGTVFAYFSIVIMNYGDYSRYVKSYNQLKKGNLSLFLNLIIFTIFSLLIVIGADIVLNKNLENMDRILTSPTDIIGKFDNTLLSVIVLFIILFASSSTNLVANYIPSQNSIINFFPNKLNLKSTSIVIGFLSFFIGIFWSPLWSQIGFLSIIDTIGSFFGPIFGIIVIDYYLVKKESINSKSLFISNTEADYFYSKGWHIKSLYALFIGFVFSASTIWNSQLLFLHSISWLFGALMSSLTYYLLTSR